MAHRTRFTCDSCAASIDSWSDGNPYVIEESGEKRYVHHPDPEHDRAVGNDVPTLCGSCGHEFNSDSRATAERCPACESSTLVETFVLGDTLCPFCKEGRFREDDRGFAVS